MAALLPALIIACSPIITEQGSINAYFCPECEGLLTTLLNQSNGKCAFYDLDSDEVIEALQDDEVIVYDENYNGFGEEVSSIGLMHNKFCIYNNRVITGSANPTERGLNVNYNNIILIDSKTIANNYLQEFSELKQRGVQSTKNPIVNLSGTLIANYFCPEDSCEEKALEALGSAQYSIHFMTFSFTSDPIGDLLIEKSKAIEVEGLMESFGLNKYSEYEKLMAAGIPVKLEQTSAMLHHKVFIVDKKIVITGSYNPTSAGNTKNDENMLIIHDQGIASQFLAEYEVLKNINAD
ncbi:phospholipase D-like domain-containing protein [Nanoarchaeota archaeon]